MKAIFKLGIVAVTILSVTLTGCSAGKNSDKERSHGVAKVNGENILKGEVVDQYNSEKGYYGITEENENSDEYKELVKNLKAGILDNLIQSKLTMQKAKEAGFTVTDEMLEKSKSEFNEILKSVEEQIKLQEVESSAENTDFAKKAKEYIDEQLKQLGMTQEQYIKLMAEQTMVQQFIDKSIGEIVISDEEIKSYYDSELKGQKEGAPTSDITLYNKPSVRVKHILIALPQEEQDEFNRLYNEQKTAEAEAYLKEKQKGILPKAQEVLSKVKGGEDFDKLIEEYGEDPGMIGNAEGYEVNEDTNFVPEFKETALKLKVGQVSELVPTTYGYHIIKAYEEIKEKVYSFDEKKAEIKEAMSYEIKNEKWQGLLDEWMKKAEITRYEDLL